MPSVDCWVNMCLTHTHIYLYIHIFIFGKFKKLEIKVKIKKWLKVLKKGEGCQMVQNKYHGI